MIKAVLFDLDGTLLPMDQDLFTKTYFKLLGACMVSLGYAPDSLKENIWTGTMAMMKNDGSCTNAEAFWHTFVKMYGPDAIKDKPVFDAFYNKEFQQAKAVCGFAPEAKEVVDLVKERGMKAVLATNPLFPEVATVNRMAWAGLQPEDFELYTTYENYSYCKPNPKYYVEILECIGCKPEECLMVGNDVDEDMVAAEGLGLKVFLLTDTMINRKDRDITCYERGSFKELKEYLKQL